MSNTRYKTIASCVNNCADIGDKRLHCKDIFGKTAAGQRKRAGFLGLATALLCLVAGPALADGVPALAGQQTRAAISGQFYDTASIIGLSDPGAGLATIARHGDDFAVAFDAIAEYSGPVDVYYRLTNADGLIESRSVRFDIVRTSDLRLNTEIPALIQTTEGASVRFADIHMDSISRRLQRLHQDGPAGNAFGVKFADQDGAVANNADALPESFLPTRWKPSDEREQSISLPPAPPPINVGFWSAGTITIGEKPGIPGITFSSGGMSFGTDYRFSDELSLGASGALSQDYSTIGETNAHLYGQYAAIYASYQPAPDAFVDAIAGVGQVDALSLREDGFDHLAATRSGTQQYVSVSAGYDMKVNSFQFTPYGGLKGRAVQLTATSESAGTAGIAIGYDGSHAWQMDGVAGASANWSIPVEAGTLKPGLRAEYRAGGRASERGQAYHVDFPDLAYDLQNSASTGSVTELGTSLALQLRHGAEIGTNYTAQRRSDDTRSQSLRVFVSGALK